MSCVEGISVSERQRRSRTHRRSSSFPNLDIPLKHLLIPKTKCKRSHGHSSRDRTKIKHALILQQPQVIKGIHTMSHSIQHHRALYLLCFLPCPGDFIMMHITHIGEPVPTPYLDGPETPVLVRVFTEVTDDVCFFGGVDPSSWRVLVDLRWRGFLYR